MEGLTISLLTIIQPVAVRFGIPLPSIAASSTNLSIQQMVAFANEEGQELASRHPWQALRYEASFTTVATESQGNILTICTTANSQAPFSYIVNETIWNRTQRRPIFGPKSPAEWQQLKAQFVQGPWYQYIIRNNTILFTPVATAGQSCYFEYMTKYWATNSASTVGKDFMTDDADITLLDERLIRLGTLWRFQQAKGLDFSATYAKYEAAVADAMARDGGKPKLNLHGYNVDVYPGTLVPAGNWTI
jgi:hypothetical protein